MQLSATEVPCFLNVETTYFSDLTAILIWHSLILSSIIFTIKQRIYAVALRKDSQDCWILRKRLKRQAMTSKSTEQKKITLKKMISQKRLKCYNRF